MLSLEEVANRKKSKKGLYKKVRRARRIFQDPKEKKNIFGRIFLEEKGGSIAKLF